MTIILHVGLPKTGTTTLQKHFFGKLPEIVYLGRPFEKNGLLAEIHQALSTDEEDIEARAAWTSHLERAQDLSGGETQTILFSDENLCGVTQPYCAELPERLKNFFGAQRILLTLRRQSDLVLSIYQHRLSRGRETVSLTDWLDQHWEDVFRPNLDWYAMINRYCKVFGKENVDIFIFERYRKDFELFGHDLMRSLGTTPDPNKRLIGEHHEFQRLTKKEIRMLRAEHALNRLHAKTGIGTLGLRRLIPESVKVKVRRFAAKGEIPKVSLPAEAMERIAAVSRDGNRRIIEKFNLPLDEYGYDV